VSNGDIEASEALEGLVAENASTSIKEFLRAYMLKVKGPAGLADEMRKDCEDEDLGLRNRARINPMIVNLMGRYGEDAEEAPWDREALEKQEQELLNGEAGS